MSMLFYKIPKIANWKNINDDSAIAINYNKTEEEKSRDIELDGILLSKEKRVWIASQMNIAPLFLIPIEEEEYFRLKADDVNVLDYFAKR